MRWRPTGAVIGTALVLSACGLKVSNTEVAAHKLIRRKGVDGKAPYYVYADPNYCQCMYVGGESQYATYKTLVQQRDDAMAALQEEREHEDFEGDK